MKHRTVQKIEPARQDTFDQQFWPVIVALTVLCGIGIGAILTLLRGPWLWGSLLLLPAISALAIYGLYLLDDSKLRRSLQLAIIVSLATHLLILMIASVVSIFQIPFRESKPAVARPQPRPIEISDRRNSFVWEEPNRRDTPEPEVEAVRQQVTTTDVKPQPIPVAETKPVVQPQLVRRETPAQSVPRQDQSLSQLRRQTQQQTLRPQQPQVAQLPTKQPNQTRDNESPQSVPTPPAPSPAAAAESTTRQADSSATSSRTPAAAETKNATTALADASPRRAVLADRSVESPAQSSPSAARNSAETSKMPRLQPTPEIAAIQNTAIEKPTPSQPSPAAAEVTRRQTPVDTVSPTAAKAAPTAANSRPQIARSVERRQSTQAAPSISSETSKLAESRRSMVDTQLTASPVAIENPARQPDSNSASTELNSKTLSISRSTAGIAGAGRSVNLETATGGLTSPATRPSDSAARRQSENAPAEVRQLASSQNSATRRAAGSAPQPTSAFKAETSAMAKISGSATPTDRSVESSAARIDSATAENRGEISAEKGSASVDLGPTKIVADTTESTRRSGGGQPEVAQLNPDSTERSRSPSSQQPTLVAAAGLSAMAPSSQSSTPVASELEPNSESTAVARTGGDSPVSFEPDAAMDAGPTANAGQADLAAELADSRQRAQRSAATGESFQATTGDDEDEDEEKIGNQRTRVAVAPIIRGETGLGGSESDLGASSVQSESPADAPSESLASNLQRTATAAIPGAGLGRSATSLLAQAAASMPVMESTAPRRAANNPPPGETGNTSGNQTAPGLAARSSNNRSSTPQPSLTNPTESVVPTTRADTGESSNVEFEAAAVQLERSASAVQEMGAAMEVVAIDGPAGLADRPDDFLGVMLRPASRESEQIQPNLDSRFRNPNFGGTPAINPDAVLAQEAFSQRAPAAMSSAAEPTTEAAIQLGLEFLARYQTPDGSWSLSAFDPDHPQHASQLNSDTAATALAVLAFQGAGYNHREYKYAPVVNQGVQWLVENQQENGSLYLRSDKKSDEACRLYSHGIAALALTEAYGMTQDIQIKSAAQKAVDYIVATQNPRKGGWRYFDDPNLQSTDTSVTGWMMMALQSGRLAGLEVDEKVFAGIDQWLDVAADPNEPSQYRYNPYAVDSDGISRLQGRQPTPSMTSVGLLMRIYSGLDRDDPALLDGATFLVLNHLPSDASPQQRDTYYWYYATQVLKHIDGPLWEKWDQQLRPLLIRSQSKTGDLAGSWHPYNPIPDRWGAFGGRLYVTTMNLLSLEVRHRMLPLYQKTNTDDE